MNTELLVEVIGWIGAAVILLAYGLVSLKKVEGDSLLFQSLNIGASLMLAINTLYRQAYPSMALNVAWIFMGLIALVRRRSAQAAR